MTEQPGEHISTTSRSKRIYILWGISLTLLLTGGLLCWKVVAPYLAVRGALSEVRGCMRVWKGNQLADAGAVKRALERLGGPERAVHRLAFYLRLPHWATTDRADAVSLLGHCGQPAVPVLTRILDEEEPGLRAVAAGALYTIGPQSRPALRALIGSLDRADIDLRNIKGLGLEKLGLIECHRLAMSSMGPAAVPELAAALGHPNPVVRCCAAEALASMGRRAKAAAPAVIKALADREEMVRASAVSAFNLLGMGSDAQEAIPALTRMLGDSTDWVRRDVVWALSKMGPAAIPALEKAFQDKSESVRQAAAEALKKIKAAQEKKK